MKSNILQKKIPKGWKKDQLSSVASVFSGATPKTSESQYWGGDIVWVTPKDLSYLHKSFLEDSERKITDLGLKSCSAVLVPSNSVIMSSRAPIGYLAINKIPVATNQGCKSIVPDNCLDSRYLYYYLVKNIDSVKRLGTGSTFSEVSKSAVESVEIIFPPLPEQKNIAEILVNVDEEIQKIDSIISKTEKLKNGVMLNLFTKGVNGGSLKKTKIGLIPEDWSLLSIKESGISIIDGDRGLNYPKSEDFSSEGYCLFLSTKNIKNDHFVFCEPQFVSKEKDDALRKGKLCRNDIILTTRGTVGNVAFYDKSITFENIRINSGMVLIRSSDDFIPDYVYHLFKSPLFKKRYAELSSGSAQPQLPIRSLENILVPIPGIEEQKKIVEISRSIDKKISVTKELRLKLIELKKGLMSDLLSGKVRTINI